MGLGFVGDKKHLSMGLKQIKVRVHIHKRKYTQTHKQTHKDKPLPHPTLPT